MLLYVHPLGTTDKGISALIKAQPSVDVARYANAHADRDTTGWTGFVTQPKLSAGA
jgi:hypothetical protein